MSWQELETFQQAHQGQQDAQQRLAGLIHGLFRTPEGQEVLEAIRLKTEARTTMPPQAVDGQGAALFMAFREGENNLYRWILSMIRKGQPHD